MKRERRENILFVLSNLSSVKTSRVFILAPDTSELSPPGRRYDSDARVHSVGSLETHRDVLTLQSIGNCHFKVMNTANDVSGIRDRGKDLLRVEFERIQI